MLATCKNCGGRFTPHEMANRRPPIHTWALTAVGQRVQDENDAAGLSRRCPVCGCRTMR